MEKLSIIFPMFQTKGTRTRGAVRNLSGNRCESDCRSRGCEFDPSLVPYFRAVCL